MAKKVSSEDQRQIMALMEMQNKVMETQQLLTKVRQQELRAGQEEKRATLTHTEVVALPAGSKTYKSVGRAFVIAPLDTVTAQLKEAIDKSSKEHSEATKSRQYLEKQLASQQAAFREEVAKHTG